MSVKAITDHQVLRAASGWISTPAASLPGSTLSRLMAATDQPARVCELAIERAISRRLCDCGVSASYAFRLQLGDDLLDVLDRLDRVAAALADGDCLTIRLDALEIAFPAGVADARRWCEQRGLWLDRASVWMRPLKVRRTFLIGRGVETPRPIQATTPAAAA